MSAEGTNKVLEYIAEQRFDAYGDQKMAATVTRFGCGTMTPLISIADYHPHREAYPMSIHYRNYIQVVVWIRTMS